LVGTACNNARRGKPCNVALGARTSLARRAKSLTVHRAVLGGTLFCRRSLPAAAIIALAVVLFAPSSGWSGEPGPIVSLYADPAPFLEAIRHETPKTPITTHITGITVPHHLLALDLIARGFWAASRSDIDHIIILSPDHFRRSKHAFATTRRSICSPLGCVTTDAAAVATLLADHRLFEESDLFDKEHGVAAMLPFIAHFFPKAKIVPLAISYDSKRPDWDRAAAMLMPLLTSKTLIVQSTDFSHYLPLETALQRDQEMLNILSARDSNAVTSLQLANHIDSKAAQYIQLKLQAHLGAVGPIVVASRNALEYMPLASSLTTYEVQLFAAAEPRPEEIRYPDQDVVFFGGDVLLGRYFQPALRDPIARAAVLKAILKITGGAPMVVNLEGVILPDWPVGAPRDSHVMYNVLAMPFLRKMHVVAASLANNHAFDFGEVGIDETARALEQHDIVPIRNGSVVDLGAFRVIALNFISKATIPGFPMARESDLGAICDRPAKPPFLALVHWGTEYTSALGAGERRIAAELRQCGVNAVIGAHSHQASGTIESELGGAQQITYSLGNLLFDQNSPRGSGSLLELRVFHEGTFASRLIPMENLFDLGSRKRRPH
jgi:AmmeMemoRadiSam system protein B